MHWRIRIKSIPFFRLMHNAQWSCVWTIRAQFNWRIISQTIKFMTNGNDKSMFWRDRYISAVIITIVRIRSKVQFRVIQHSIIIIKQLNTILGIIFVIIVAIYYCFSRDKLKIIIIIVEINFQFVFECHGVCFPVLCFMFRACCAFHRT